MSLNSLRFFHGRALARCTHLSLSWTFSCVDCLSLRRRSSRSPSRLPFSCSVARFSAAARSSFSSASRRSFSVCASRSCRSACCEKKNGRQINRSFDGLIRMAGTSCSRWIPRKYQNQKICRSYPAVLRIQPFLTY